MKTDCFWGAKKCVPGSNGACKNCTAAQKHKNRGQSRFYESKRLRKSGTVPARKEAR